MEFMSYTFNLLNGSSTEIVYIPSDIFDVKLSAEMLVWSYFFIIFNWALNELKKVSQ